MPLIYKDGAFEEAETPRICVGGVFEDSVGYVCKDGIWEQVWPTKLWLYRDGDKCSEVTGGWTDFRARGDNGNPLMVWPTASFAATYILFSGTDDENGFGSKSTFTNRKIDFDRYTKLCMEVEAVHTSTSVFSVIGIASQNETWGTGDKPIGGIVDASDTNLINHLTQYVVELDITAITGQAYVYVKGYGHANTVKIKRVWLEK